MRGNPGSSRLTALLVVPSLAGGGAERCALEVSKNLDRHSLRAHLLPFVREGEYAAELPPRLLVPARGGGAGRLLARLPRFVRKWIVPAAQVAWATRRLRPHVVITFLPEASLPTSLVRWLRLAPRFVWVISEQNATRRRVLEGNPSLWRRRLQDSWIRWAYRAADQVVAVSEGVKKGLIRDYGLQERQIGVILNPVDRQRVHDDSARELPPEWRNAHFLLFMGRLTRQKGLDVLLEAFALVRRKEPIALVLLGVGEERERLEALAAELHVADHVHFLGFKANPWPYVKRASVFVLSSRWEGCPLVIGEAMACETPVVATDCDYGPRELIENGTNGLLVPPENPQALADAILELLFDPARADSLGRMGAARARELDSPAIARQYAELLRRLVGSS